MTCISCTSCNVTKVDDPFTDEPVLPANEGNIWMINSLDDIDSYAGMEPQNVMTVMLLKNENENVQAVISAGSNKALSIVREGNPEVIDFRCSQVKSFDVLKNDVLVPCEGTVTPENKLLKVWLSFKARTDAAPGTYRETIWFRNEGAEYGLAFYIVVKDAMIPEKPSISSAFGINPDNLILTGMDEGQKQEMRREISDLLLEYRADPYFSTWLSGSMKTECFSSPYAIDDERSWAYLSDPRFNRIALPYHSLDDEGLKQMLERAGSEGLVDKAFFYVWDEPVLPSEYASIRAMADRIHMYSPQAKVLTSFYCGPKEGESRDDLFAVFDALDGATGIFCTSAWALQKSESISEMCRKKLRDGQEWWMYVCMSEYPGLAQNATGIPNRAVMWRNWKERAGGFLYWVVNSFSSMSPLKPRSDLPAGDGILVYPGKPFGSSMPCVSIRLERWRDGAEDYEMLCLYEQKHGRAAAEELLKKVYQGPASFTSGAKYVEAFRKKLIEGIAE
ncbi:MAG: DUF4091 domain-containing protein [Bacteroides sp.]|nr:DUF4091 domain-containing protein [Bacteroides sp.]